MSPQLVIGVSVWSKNSSTVSLLITHNVRRSSASWLNTLVYYTLVDCNPLTALLRFVLDLSYKLFLHCYAAVGKILTDISLRAVRLQ